MKELLDIEKWNRRDHFLFYSQFSEPFFGVTVSVDCTEAYRKAKERGNSFYLYYLYRALKAANSIENFRLEIESGQVFIHDSAGAGPTVDRPDETFGFAYMPFIEDEQEFYRAATAEIERVRNTSGLEHASNGRHIIHFTTLPWLDFTSFSHARQFTTGDCSPKIAFGKMTESDGSRTMPVSIHGHHALMDGYHVGLFVSRFQDLLNQ
jgi:chloramphenicol O-acetyltransferase type A